MRRVDRRLIQQITTARHGLDPALIAVPKRGSQFANALNQGIVGYRHIGPNRFNELILGQQPAGTPAEIYQQRKALWPQGNHGASDTQFAALQVDVEIGKVKSAAGESGPARRYQRRSARFSCQFRRSFGTLSGVVASTRLGSAIDAERRRGRDQLTLMLVQIEGRGNGVPHQLGGATMTMNRRFLLGQPPAQSRP